LWRRELVGSTALGHGAAIPHARIDGPVTVFLPSNGDTDITLRCLRASPRCSPTLASGNGSRMPVRRPR
jgi:hypothetical protein